MTVLGIDYGLKRIGLAVSRGGERPERLEVLANDEHFTQRLLELVAHESVRTIVVGLPRNLDGDDTPQTHLVRHFAEQLRGHVGADIVLQDEADTSNVGRERLKREGLADREIERLIDAEAAAIILEDYLGS
jgi:putative Holliday junction resolvase